MVARGGRGGISPSSRQRKDGRAPERNERVNIELELRLVNDAAFIGLPNAGKSSLIASITRQHTRIGPEPHSTSRPHVGVVRYRDGLDLRILDTPPLLKHAHLDKKKGRRVLRHLYRSKLLVYVIDVTEAAQVDSMEALETLMEEVKSFDDINKTKPELVVATKCDMLHRHSLLNLDSLYFRVRAIYPDIQVVGTSARFGLGMDRVVELLRELLTPSNLVDARRVPAQYLHDVLLPTPADVREASSRFRQLPTDRLPTVWLPHNEAAELHALPPEVAPTELPSRTLQP